MTMPRPVIFHCNRNFSLPDVKDLGLKELQRCSYKYSSSAQEDGSEFGTCIQMQCMLEERLSLT